MIRTVEEALAHAEQQRAYALRESLHLISDFILLADEVKRLREFTEEAVYTQATEEEIRRTVGPRRCSVCNKPGFGEVCSPECSAIATTKAAHDAGYFPPDVSWAELFDGLDQCKARYAELGILVHPSKT